LPFFNMMILIREQVRDTISSETYQIRDICLIPIVRFKLSLSIGSSFPSLSFTSIFGWISVREPKYVTPSGGFLGRQVHLLLVFRFGGSALILMALLGDRLMLLFHWFGSLGYWVLHSQLEAPPRPLPAFK